MAIVVVAEDEEVAGGDMPNLNVASLNVPVLSGSSTKVRSLGEYIREQRRAAQISLRQLARMAGVSNPYLSQIERGLRRPSADILQQIAKALRISAEVLYVQAGILEAREGAALAQALRHDAHLNERQKQVLFEIYASFRKENQVRIAAVTATDLAAPDGVDIEVSGEPALSAAESATECPPGHSSATSVAALANHSARNTAEPG